MPAVSDDEFIKLIKTLGVTAASKKLGVTARAVGLKRRRIEDRYGIELRSPISYNGKSATQYEAQINIKVDNGTILIGSDAHIQSPKPSTAMRAFIHLCKELKPKAVILNGDVLDFPTISRHPRIGWSCPPMPHEEIEAAQGILHEIEQSCSRGVHKLWPLGNHDLRFETKLANSNPDFARIHGVHLVDHFHNWSMCWNVAVNEKVIIKHRFKGGIHAPHMNTMWAGCSIVTGHLHSQKVSPFSDYVGTRYGVDTGCLADVNNTAFIDYSENSPKNWRSGFCLLTFKNGDLLPPELVTVWNERSVVFRGEIIRV